MHSLIIAFALMAANVQPTRAQTTITVHEVVITAPLPAGIEQWRCDPTWKDLASGSGQYKDCAVFYSDGKGNWTNRDYRR